MIYFVAAILIILLPDLYIWAAFLRDWPQWAVAVWWAPSVLIILSLLIGLSYRRESLVRLGVLFFMSVTLPEIIFSLLSVAGRLLSSAWQPAFGLLNTLGALLGAVTLVVALIGMTIGWRILTVRRVSLRFKRLPRASDGYRIVQLSDFHIGTYHRAPAMVSRIVERVNSLEPDLVVFTGDLVNFHPSEAEEFAAELAKIKAPDGVVAILGNHDYCTIAHTSAREQVTALNRLKQLEASLGWQLLLNKGLYIGRGGQRIFLAGVENDGQPPFPQLARLDDAFAQAEASDFKILLSHDPSHWRRSVLPHTDVDLMLAGHTHAMQLRLGSLSPARLSQKEWGGIYRHTDGRTLYVSTGVGSNVPFRFGAWPAIDLITLHCDD